MGRKTKQTVAEEKTKFISMLAKVICGWCEKEVASDKVTFGSWESECEMCGSHGSIYFTFHCPNCDKYLQIELNSW